ncbi:MAG: MaoC family dehydratase N-terminal domain-containing protein [Candidatus Sericytochromatia bacterium]|nr:MaoC family dehydratase N-terminal domain-containing protein [Candidatus Sericytochromatia bacterium]
MPVCQRHTYEAIAIGDHASLTTTIGTDAVDRFAALTGDLNPLHTNEAFARLMGQPQRVVHGLLVGAYFSQLVGMQLPGERCLVHRVDLQFPAPTHVGDELVFEIVVDQKIDSVQALVLKATARRQGEIVARGKIQVGVLSDPLP